LLDFYEAAQLHRLQLRPPLGSLDADYLEFTRQLRRIAGDPRPVGEAEIINFHRQVTRYFNFLPAGVRPLPTHDFGRLPQLPPGCAVEQLATYYDQNGRIDVDTEIWAHLDSMSQAGLFAHEVFWHEYRGAGEKVSINARSLVAHLFARIPSPKQDEGVPAGAPQFWAVRYAQTGTSVSTSDKTSNQFWAYPDPRDPNRTVLQFFQIMGKSTYYPVRIIVPARISAASFKNPYQPIVVDPSANLNLLLKINSGMFQGYGITILYRTHEVMKIGFVDPKGTLLNQSAVLSFRSKPTLP
jgi:hypothetical protein